MIEAVGGTTRLAELGTQTLEDGTQLPLPPVLLGQIGDDPQKKTLLMYGHLDVQPAKKVSANFLAIMYNNLTCCRCRFVVVVVVVVMMSPSGCCLIIIIIIILFT